MNNTFVYTLIVECFEKQKSTVITTHKQDNLYIDLSNILCVDALPNKFVKMDHKFKIL